MNSPNGSRGFKGQPDRAGSGGGRGYNSHQQIEYTPKATQLQPPPVKAQALRRADGKTCGVVYGRVLRKTVQPRHMLLKPPAWAIDAWALEKARELGVETVEVIEAESRTTYRTTLAHFLAAGVKFNRGYGEQVYLPLEGWARLVAGAPVQLDLWGAA